MSPIDSSVAVVIPIKSFDQAKNRLGAHLDNSQRRALAESMALRVIEAAKPMVAFVACDSHEIATWAESVGAEALMVPADGLNTAVTDAVDSLAKLGFKTAVVSHGDLPFAAGFDHLVDTDASEVVLVPDRHHDGTNVIVTPTTTAIEFCYGPGSFLRHIYSAVSAGHSIRIIADPLLGWDVDEPADLKLADGTSVLDRLNHQGASR